MDLNEFVKLPQLPSGRQSYAVRQILELATALTIGPVRDRAEQALESAAACRAVEQKYASDSSRAKHGKGAEGANARLDRGWGRLDARLAGEIETFGLDHAIGAAAARLRKNLAADGISTITALSYVEEVETSEMLVRDMATKYKDDVQTLSLGAFVERLGQLTEALKKELKQPVERPTWDQVQAARAEMHARLTRLVIAIEGYCLDRGDAKQREQLLAPLVEQVRAYSARYRARRGATDVDPETGDERTPLPEPTPPAPDTPASPAPPVSPEPQG